MTTPVVVTRDGRSGAWRIKDAAGSMSLFGGVEFASRSEAARYVKMANIKVGSRRWTVRKSKGETSRQLSIF